MISLWKIVGISIVLFMASSCSTAIKKQKTPIAQKEQNTKKYTVFKYEKLCGDYPHRYSSVNQMKQYEFGGRCDGQKK
jgi:hypothetical protein